MDRWSCLKSHTFCQIGRNDRHCVLLQQGEENVGSSPAASVATDLTAKAGNGAGDRFASIAQAAFTAAVAKNSESITATGTGARPTFMMRSATGGRRWKQADGVRAYKSCNSAPTTNMSSKWKVPPPSSGAAAGAVRSGLLHRESIASRRGASPHSTVRSSSPVASVCNSATFLGMPPMHLAESDEPGEREVRAASPVAAGERRSKATPARPSGWGAIRAMGKPTSVDTPRSPTAAAPAEAVRAAADPPASPGLRPSAHQPNGGVNAAARVVQEVPAQTEAQGAAAEEDDKAVRAIARLWRAGHGRGSSQGAADGSSDSPEGTARTAQPQHEDANGRTAPGRSSGLPAISSGHASRSTQRSTQVSAGQHSTASKGQKALHKHQDREANSTPAVRAGVTPSGPPTLAALDTMARAPAQGDVGSLRPPQHQLQGVRADGGDPSRDGIAAWRRAASLAIAHQSVAAAGRTPPAEQLPNSTQHGPRGSPAVKTLPSFPGRIRTGAEPNRDSSSSSSLDSAA